MPKTPASARLANNVLARGDAENRENRDVVRDDANEPELVIETVTDADADGDADDTEFDMVQFL